MSELRKAIDDELLRRARAMRHDPAPAEKKLWRLLRDRQLNGFKFRRQHRIAGYIADFYCHEAALVVELDGASHGDRVAYDERRTKRIERRGHHVIRFVNDDVFWHTDAVLQAIYDECLRLSGRVEEIEAGPHPGPLPEYRERG
jgi:very-short-patch-repair endonuclease